MTYSVWSVGEAGIPRPEVEGLRCPVEAMKVERRLQAERPREHFYCANDSDAESSVEREAATWEERHPTERESING